MTEPTIDPDAAPPLSQLSPPPVPDPEQGVIATDFHETDGIGVQGSDAGTQPVDSNEP